MADFSPEQLEACLLQLTNPNTEQIKQAEAALKPYLKKISSVGGLMTQLQLSQKAEVRQLAALMLRKKLFKHWPKIDEGTQAGVKQALLARAAEDPVPVVRSAVATLISSLALHEVPSGKWPELMIFINTGASSGSEDQREISMKLLQLLGESMGTHLQPHFNDLKNLYIAALQDPQSLKVRVASMRAACALIEFLEESDLRGFQTLVPLMIEVLQQCIVNGAESEAVEFLDMFSEIASHPFPILDQAFPAFIELLLQVIVHDKLEVSTRASASYAIGEFIKKKPKTIGRKNLVGKIFTTMLDIVASDDDVSCGLISNLLERDSKEGDDDDEDESPGHLAQQTLDSLALSVPAKYLNSVVFGICNEYIQSPDARKRKAGVLALGILSEGCCEFMCQNVNELLPAVYRVAQDPDQKVREAACFALGQFAEFLQPNITDHYTDILPIGIALLDDSTKAIKATALYVLDEITQSMESHQVLPYLDTLVTKLMTVLGTSSPQLQKMSLDALGSIAIGAKEAFLPYFTTVVDLIQPFWNITDPKYFFLRGAAIECLGYLATALGKDAFRPYFAPSMPFVFASFDLDDSELKEQAFVYFINVTSIFKEEFAPFLEQAATHVLRAIESDEGIRVVDDEEDVLEGLDSDDDEDDDENLLRHISIRTDALNSKVRAVAAVEEMALNCGAIFEPYIPKFLEALAPLTEYIHEDVRAAVAEALAALVICSFDASHPGSVDTQVWTKGDFNKNILTPNNTVIVNAVMKALVEDLLEDPEEVVVEKTFNAIKAMSARVGPVVTVDHMTKITRVTKAVLCHEHVCQASAEDDDDEESEGGSVLEASSELIGVLGKCYGEQFLGTFQEIFPQLLSFAQGIRASRDRAAAVGCFAEVLRELGPSSLNFVESVFPVVIQGLASGNFVLKANSAFCVGILAEISGDKLYAAYEQILHAVRPLFDAEANDDVVVDNACAAVARLILAGVAHVPLEHVLPVFLGALPLKADFDENNVVFSCLNGLVKSQNPAVVNFIPQIIEVYAKSLASSNVDEEDQVEIKVCVRGLFGLFEAQIKEIAAQLSPELQSALSSALN
ncbi:Importin-like protein, partial [Globisporangium splendens]